MTPVVTPTALITIVSVSIPASPPGLLNIVFRASTLGSYTVSIKGSFAATQFFNGTINIISSNDLNKDRMGQFSVNVAGFSSPRTVQFFVNGNPASDVVNF